MLRLYARLGVYGSLLALVPVDIYVVGLSFWEVVFVLCVGFGLATATIELTFIQGLKLRKRSTYPGRVLAETGGLSSLAEAEAAAVAVVRQLLGLSQLALVETSGGAHAVKCAEGWSVEEAERLAHDLRDRMDECLRTEESLVVRQRGAEVLLAPVVSLTNPVGVLLGRSVRLSRDAKDSELTRGMGLALGLAIENYRQKEEIERKEERLRTVVTAAPIVLINVDAGGTITLLEGKGLERVTASPQEIVGRSVFDVFGSFPPIVEAFERALAGEVVVALAELTQTVFETQLTPVRDPATGAVTGVIGVATDVTERRRAEETIRRMAYHDSLTGLPNRELFENNLAEALARARRKGGFLAVLFIDIDRFKLVNDSRGHAAGDRVLQGFARQLESLVREGDTLARLGGDEFVLLLPEIAGPTEAEAVAQRILAGVRSRELDSEAGVVITASIGVAVFPVDGADGEALLRQADAAMYQAKQAGRNRYAVASPAAVGP
jgi:diguanylate cyclase (GGDEF)-like protein/PAS domain S-box-containing protein